ncbi:MAG: KEOPS complex subunit Pcc1 [Candidatus Methanoperedens sp.]
MKIEGKLTFKGERAEELVNIIAESLAPDNVPGIKTIIENDSVTVLFEGIKVGTILSSVDDYLMNAAIVEKLFYTLREGLSYSQYY